MDDWFAHDSRIFRLVLLYYFTALLNIYTVCTLALNNYRKSYKLTNYMYCLKSYQQFHYIWCFLSISSAKNQERILWHSLADSIVVWLPRNPSNGCHLLLQILPQGNMARWYWCRDCQTKFWKGITKGLF